MTATVTTPKNVRPQHGSREVPAERPTEGIRGNIAFRSQGEDSRAVDLEARCLEAGAPLINGLVPLLCGGTSDRRLRYALAGSAHLHLLDLCRLATTPGIEAKAALRSILTILAGQIGETLEPQRAPGRDWVEEVAESMEASAAFHAGFGRALKNDGLIDHAEALALLPLAMDAKRELADPEAIVVKAASR